MADYSDKETLLKVEHLCQYFKMGNSYLKAVDDVNFEIKKGEVLGLVGESGCGKTTTGRSIIKLYDITDGNVYFKNTRICAGTATYKKAIKDARAKLNEAKNAENLIKKYEAEISKLNAQLSEDDASKTIEKKIAKLDAKIADLKEKIGNDPNAYIAKVQAETDEIISKNKEEIRKAKFDQKKCDKEYQQKQVAKVIAKYEPLIENATEEQQEALKAEYKNELRKARKTRLVTQIQMIFQDPIASLDPRMTVKDIISEGLVIQGEKDKKVIEEKVFEMLELVGLVREHASRYPHEFSGGQRQRIGVARAVIMNPEMIIADEPVSALDVSIQAQVINLLNDLRKSMNLTILFIAHDLSVVKYFSDRIAVMYFGKMVELASSEELFLNPLHPYTRSLLSAIPLPDPIYEKNRKRIVYNPLAEHDYSVDKPSMHEIKPGHLVYCNEKEFEDYKKIVK